MTVAVTPHVTPPAHPIIIPNLGGAAVAVSAAAKKSCVSEVDGERTRLQNGMAALGSDETAKLKFLHAQPHNIDDENKETGIQSESSWHWPWQTIPSETTQASIARHIQAIADFSMNSCIQRKMANSEKSKNETCEAERQQAQTTAKKIIESDSSLATFDKLLAASNLSKTITTHKAGGVQVEGRDTNKDIVNIGERAFNACMSR